MLQGMSLFPKIHCPMVDVRQCAEIHIKCFERPEMVGKRVIASDEESPMLNDIADAIEKTYGNDGWKCRKNEMPTWIFKLMGYINTDAKVMGAFLPEIKCDNTIARRDLGIKFRSLQEISDEMLLSLLKMDGLDRKSIPATKVEGYKPYP
eukprot:Trichotokara_eunicae@DN5915_c0_g1_i5.p1